MLGFKTFINEVKKEENNIELVLSKRFSDILYDLTLKGSNLAKEIKELEKSKDKFDISFIDISDKADDMISYITSNKAKPVLDKYKSINKENDGKNICWVTNRQEQKITRFVPRIFGTKFNQKEIEDFLNDYKVAVKGDKSFDNFEMIEGEDVKKYYSGKQYSREANGQLQRSCMKYDEANGFFELYIQNPDKMKMLILKDGKDKIFGRANLWYLDDPKGKVFMDRIYTTFDWQIKLYIDYANKNNYIYKSKQIYGGDVIPVMINGKKEKLTMTVKIKPGEYKKYPYVDTLQFYNKKEGTLTSDISKFNKDGWVTLCLASGEAFTGGQGDGFNIDYLGRIVYEPLLVWSKHDKVYVHQNDAVSLDYKGDYVTPEHDFVKVDGMICLKEDTIFDEKTGKYILKEKF